MQKKHILIFAIPGIIIVILLIILIIFQATKNSQKKAVETSQPTSQTAIKVEKNENSNVSATKREIPVYILPGKPLKLGLPSSPTTGFSWQIDFDTNFFKLTNKYYIAKGDKKLVGSSGTQYFEFETLKTGVSEIKFEYKKPWEPNASAEETRIYKISVTDTLPD